MHNLMYENFTKEVVNSMNSSLELTHYFMMLHNMARQTLCYFIQLC
jgi:hypothetical protein